MFVVNQSGWIEVICGSMFSGKSEELIKRVRKAQFAKETVAVFKPVIDNRFSEVAVVSHNGSQVQAISISSSLEILNRVDASVDVVAIDEAQFLDQDLVEVAQALANRGHRVVLAGLDQDFRGEPFGPMPQLMSVAELVTKLHAVCSVCGSPASRTQRLIDRRAANYDDPIIMVGASESYEPRCRHHHDVPGKPSTLIETSPSINKIKL